jgi:uncharacterized protein (DUF1697 family)
VRQDGGVADYVAFLRAINLGKNRKFPMAELRACLEDAGFDEVETYIQTGNVRVRSTLRSHARLADRLEEIFEADRGFAVPTVVVTAKELRQVYDDALRLEPPSAAHADGLRRYVTLLKEPPSKATATEVEELSTDEEVAWVRGRAVHLWMKSGYQNARLNNAKVEKMLGVATTRDLKVITTLAERWGA